MDMTSAERQVMRVIWAYPHSRSQEVIERLAADFSWKPATIKTLLNRLKEKGFLQMVKEEGKFYYDASLSEEEQFVKDSQDLLENVCSTQHAHLLSYIMEESQLSQADIAALMARLQKRQETAPRQVHCQCAQGQCNCQHGEDKG